MLFAGVSSVSRTALPEFVSSTFKTEDRVNEFRKILRCGMWDISS